MNDQQTHERDLMRSMTRLDARLETLHQDVAEVKSAMHKLAEAITKLAVIEERQAQVSSAVDRAFAAIATVQQQVSSLEVRLAAVSPVLGSATKWIDRALVALVAAGLGYYMKGAA